MICKIADLIAEVPAAGGMAPRCRDYLTDETLTPEVVISEASYRPERYPGADYDLVCYMESGRNFYGNLVRHSGIMLHASAVEWEGKAYLFSGPCTVGKSTHTGLWQSLYGEKAQVFNDDKPALRYLDGTWFAYGTPWCGKDGINQNKKVPLGGICFLSQATENRMRRLSSREAVVRLMSQTMHRFVQAEDAQKLLHLLDKLISLVPVYELENRPDLDAARLSSTTMGSGTTEAPKGG